MILVPSRQLRLNGNRLIFLFIFCLSFTSCELFRVAQVDEKPTPKSEELDPIPGKKVYDPETGTLVIVDQTPVEPMDTVKWKDIPTDSVPPIQSETIVQDEEEFGNPSELISKGEYGTEFHTAYEIAVILPFLTDRFNEASNDIYNNSKWALNFYGGMLMAFDELGDEGIKLNLTVIDSKASEKTIANLLSTRSELFNSHLIIGPYRKDNIRLVANFAKRNNITHISPHSAASNLTNNNPNYIQVSPTLQTHCKAITQHIRATYRPDQVVLLARDKAAEKARFAYFQEENFRIEGYRADSIKFREIAVEEGDDNFRKVDLNSFMQPRDTTVFVIPSWSNENFIYSFLAYAKIAKSMSSHVVVYGMPQWTEYTRIDFELYETMNVHVSADTYLDYYDTDVNFFRKRFFDRFGTPPTEEAFLAYDVSKYVGRMIHKYGTKFQYFVEQEPEQMLHTRFDFERVGIPRTTGTENVPIERFENKYVNILKFQNYQFQIAN